MSSKIFFLHIPKTWGTSLHHLLKDCFDESAIMPRTFLHMPWEHQEHLPDDLLPLVRSYEYVYGHLGWGVYDECASDFSLLTFLRDPVDRVVSLYNDFRTKSQENYETASHQGKKIIEAARELSLDRFLESGIPWVKDLFRDGQTRQVLSGVSDGSVSAELAISFLDSHGAYVGIMEEFNTEIRTLLGFLLGGQSLQAMPHKNTSRWTLSTKDLDKNTYALVKEYTTQDQILYNTYKRRTQRAELKRLTSVQTKALVLNFDEKMLGSNWHEREGRRTGRVWRWTGPGPSSTLKIDIWPGKYAVYFFIISCFELSDLEALNISIDTQPIETEYLWVVDGAHCLMGYVNISSWDLHTRELMIVCPAVRSHADIHPDNDDTRKKGVAFSSIRFCPQ